MSRNLVLPLFVFALGFVTGTSAAEQTFTIAEPFGLEWGPDRVSYPVHFAQGEVTANGCSLKDANGQPIAVQLVDADLWPDKTIKKAKLVFMVTLTPNQSSTWKLTRGPASSSRNLRRI